MKLIIQTGRSMDINVYTVEVYQRGDSGVLTHDIGKEEVGIVDIKVDIGPPRGLELLRGSSAQL